MRGKISDTGVLFNGYDPHPGQLEVHDSEARYRVCICGRRWGKSTFALNEILKNAWLNTDPLARCWYIGPNYRQAKTVAWEMIKSIIPEQIIASVNEAELMVRLINGSIIEIKGADAQDSLRGSKLFFVVLDEYATMRSSVWEEIVRPSMADCKGSKAIFIGTPAGMHNHFKTLYDEANTGKKNWQAWMFKTSDNPYVDAEELEEIRKTTDVNVYRQEYEAEFVEMAGAIFPMFKKTIHVMNPTELPEHYERVVGMDWGMRNDTAVIFAAISERGEIFVYDLLYGNGKTVSQWAEIIRNRHDFMNITQWIIDPAALSQAREFGNYGINFISYNPETLKKINDVHIGINLMQQYFLEGKIKIFSHCDVLIKQLEQYQWEPNNSKIGLDPRPKPLKKDDHSCFAAGTKIITKQGYKNIEDITENDFVLTRYGFKQVDFAGSVGIRRTFKYKFSNGKILECTPDHPLIIDNVKKPIDSLRYRDRVESWTCQTSTEQPVTHGVNLMEKYLKGIISTIKTVIQGTTASPTWSVFPPMSTNLIIGSYGAPTMNGCKFSETIWTTSENYQKHGISQKKEVIGTNNMPSNINLENGNQESLFVKYVQKPILHLKDQIQNFVQTIVNHKQDDYQVKTSSIKLATHVLQHLKKISIQKFFPVQGNAAHFIEKSSTAIFQKVYNLTVKDNHEYYANGILVSNCDALRYLVSARMASKVKAQQKYKNLNPQSELFWRTHNNDIPAIARQLMPIDPMMSGIDDIYGTNDLNYI